MNEKIIKANIKLSDENRMLKQELEYVKAKLRYIDKDIWILKKCEQLDEKVLKEIINDIYKIIHKEEINYG